MRPQLLTAPEDWPTSNCIQRWFPSIFVTLRETRKLTYQHVKGDNFMLWQCLKKKLMKSILTWEWFAPLGLSEMDCKNLTSISYLERTFGSVKSSYMYQNFPSSEKNFASKEFLNSLWNLCDYFFLALDVGGGGGHLQRVSNVALQNIYTRGTGESLSKCHQRMRLRGRIVTVVQIGKNSSLGYKSMLNTWYRYIVYEREL